MQKTLFLLAKQKSYSLNFFASFAVDFPKTGYMAEMPVEMKNRRIEYPDFMQKAHARSYKSKGVIGQMFRECKRIYQCNGAAYVRRHEAENKIKINESFRIDGHEAYLKEAHQLYAQYRSEIERLMAYFGCDKENELIVGVCVSGSLNDEAREQKKVSSLSIRKIWQYYRGIFFESFESLSDLPPSAFQVIKNIGFYEFLINQLNTRYYIFLIVHFFFAERYLWVVLKN